jgi:hypothetical protein
LIKGHLPSQFLIFAHLSLPFLVAADNLLKNLFLPANLINRHSHPIILHLPQEVLRRYLIIRVLFIPINEFHQVEWLLPFPRHLFFLLVMIVDPLKYGKLLFFLLLVGLIVFNLLTFLLVV